MSELSTNASDRLISLDALRGFTIAGMVIVNDPGSWSHVFSPLLHAEWNGSTPTDLVFPFFLFMVGVSIALAYTKRIKAGADKKDLYKKILSRTVKIYLLGMFLTLFPKFDFANIRLVGVLPRISIVFFFAAIIFLNTNWKQQIRLAIGILVGYFILMVYIPIPGIGAPDLSGPETNWANWIDKNFLPGRMYRGTWDPEGILSTFPAIVTSMVGMLIGTLILSLKDVYKKLTWLFFAGFIMLLIGEAWHWFFPINKHIWTSSYVMYAGGLATLSLAACILVVDILGYHKWTFIGRVYGANAITSYVLAGLLTQVFYRDLFGFGAPNKLFMNGMTGLVSAEMASFMYAILYMLIIFLPALFMYRKKIFIRV